MKLEWTIFGFGFAFAVWYFDIGFLTRIVFTAIEIRKRQPYRGITIYSSSCADGITWTTYRGGKGQQTWICRGPIVKVSAR